MTNDPGLATKSDLTVIEGRLLNAIRSMDERIDIRITSLEYVMQRRFHFVAEQLTQLHNKFDGLQKDLDEISDTLENHERRIQRLERRRQVAA